MKMAQGMHFTSKKSKLDFLPSLEIRLKTHGTRKLEGFLCAIENLLKYPRCKEVLFIVICGIFADNPAFPSLQKLHHCFWQQFFFVYPGNSIGPAHSPSVTRISNLK